MNLIASVAVLAASLALLFFGRGRAGEDHPIFRKFPWVVGQMFALTILCLFAAGLMGILVNMNWLH
jgi:uncharacterized membrane protein SpoIIM required for sporulation